MRSLVVSFAFPWPATTGARMRLANAVAGLAAAGEVELLSFVSAGRLAPGTDDPCVVPTDAPVLRAHVLPRARPSAPLPRRLVATATQRMPLKLTATDWTEQRAAVQKLLAEGGHDVVWLYHSQSWLAVGVAADGVPVVVDVDDLEDEKALARSRLRPRRGGAGARVRGAAAVGAARLDARAWRDVQRRVVSTAAGVVVSSELDRDRLGRSDARVIPNGYDAPAAPAGGSASPPTILLQGSLSYEPNLDAARLLVEEVGPHLWRGRPDVVIRLVGRADERARALARPGRVVVTGFVPDIRDELARATVIAAPLRFGGGTRLKILEGFAHRVPVVATTMGVEGIAARDGEHLLVRDDPREFADACLGLLEDAEDRRRLADAAARLFAERYDWASIQPLFAEAARAAVESAARPEPGQRQPRSRPSSS